MNSMFQSSLQNTVNTTLHKLLQKLSSLFSKVGKVETSLMQVSNKIDEALKYS